MLEWIDLPLEQRPRLIIGEHLLFLLSLHFYLLQTWLPRGLVYEPMLDQAGHAAGPDSELVNAST